MITIPPRVASAWTALRRRAAGSTEFDLLARTFFARFFDNDITGGSNDLKASFFWLLAFLAVPGMAIPVMMSFDWDIFAMAHGTEALRIASRGDKAFYLGFAMIASGLLSAIVWSSLLLDRRDCLVLGTLPVSGPRIVRAKLTALCTYILMVTVGMHALASASYGFFLAAHSSLAFALAGAVAHLVASCAASGFVFFAMAATQGVLFATIGPRRYKTLSPWLQAALVCLVLLGLMALPLITTSTVDTLGPVATITSGPSRYANADAVAAARAAMTVDNARPWILKTPPLWFLGLYEMVLRTDDPTLIRLGRFALAGLAAAGIITVLTYPVAYRRLVSAVVEMPAPAPRHGWTGRLVEWVVACVSRNPLTRASSQFFLTTVRRNTRHRLAMALAVGATIAFLSPTLLRWAPRLADLPPAPGIDVLALPFEAMLFLLIGLRVAAALPADLDSSWMLDSIGPPARPLRSGLWRTMFMTTVVPVSILATALVWSAWGARLAWVHALVCLAFGGIVIEALLWGFDALPCSRPWRPEQANLRKWWPGYLAIFLFISGGLPTLEQLSFDRPAARAALVGGLVVTGLALRITHRRRRIIPDEDIEVLKHVQVLNLD